MPINWTCWNALVCGCLRRRARTKSRRAVEMLFELARSLTRSPATAAIEEAHRMARRRFESGGATGSAADKPTARDFVLPAGVDPLQVAMAIEPKLRADKRSTSNGDSSSRLHGLQRRSDGRVVVPAELVERLGGGDMNRGVNLLEGIIAHIRTLRILDRLRL
jgi:hypothetical protein